MGSYTEKELREEKRLDELKEMLWAQMALELKAEKAQTVIHCGAVKSAEGWIEAETPPDAKGLWDAFHEGNIPNGNDIERTEDILGRPMTEEERCLFIQEFEDYMEECLGRQN